MLGSHLIHSGLNQDFQSAASRGGFSPALLKRFSNNSNHLGEQKQAQADSSAQAGQVMMARLMTSMESRFSIAQVQQVAPQTPVAAADDFSPEAVSDRILGFVKERLAQEKANGASDERLQSLFNQAKAGLEKGFAEARQIIGEQGLFNDQVKDNYFATVARVEEGMDELEQSLFGSSESNPPATETEASPASVTSLATNELYYNQKRAFDMQVKTQDGDVVTIKVKAGESFSASSFAAANDDVSVSGFDAEYTNHSRFSFSVEGDLDEGELAALNDLFAQVNDIADDFFAGDVDAAFEQALDVGYDASELAGFAVNMRRTQVVAVRQTYAEVAQYSDPGSDPAAPIQNPFQDMMDKLTDFSTKVQQAHQALLDGAQRLQGDSLFGQLLKELVPETEQQNTQGEQVQDVASKKASFDQFLDTLLA